MHADNFPIEKEKKPLGDSLSFIKFKLWTLNIRKGSQDVKGSRILFKSNETKSHSKWTKKLKETAHQTGHAYGLSQV